MIVVVVFVIVGLVVVGLVVVIIVGHTLLTRFGQNWVNTKCCCHCFCFVVVVDKET